ncbi:MAG TPA: hypothetical protein VG329_04545 [Candidatus Dormibacteraeota bacterium]|nr:hypothetical protein [Candidatus Dormibacteraeota bacterium]
MNGLPCNVGTPGAGVIAVTYGAPPNGTVTLVCKATTLESLRVNSGAGGTVTSDVGGLDCGSTCAQSYPYNTSVTLTATPQPNYRFAGWGADCSGTAVTCTLSMTAPHTVSASFQATVQLTVVTVVQSGACPAPNASETCYGTGSLSAGYVFCATVTSSTNAFGQTCGPYTVDAGTPITFNASAGGDIPASTGARPQFVGWGGGPCAGQSASCTFTPTSNVTVTGTFGP